MKLTPADHAKMLWHKAENDLIAARAILETGRALDTVSFHAQQAAEKSLKALITFHDLPYARDHDLGALIVTIKANLTNFTLDERSIELLDPFAVRVRYDASLDPSIDVVFAAIQTAEDLHSRVGLVIQD